MSLALAFAHFAHQNPLNLSSFLIIVPPLLIPLLLYHHLSSFLFHLLDTRSLTLRPLKKYHSHPKIHFLPPNDAASTLQPILHPPPMHAARNLSRYHLQTIYSSFSPFLAFLALALAPLLHEFSFHLSHRFILHSSWGFRSLNHALHHSSVTHSALSAMYMSGPDFHLEIVVPYLALLSVLSTYILCNTATCIAIEGGERKRGTTGGGAREDGERKILSRAPAAHLPHAHAAWHVCPSHNTDPWI